MGLTNDAGGLRVLRDSPLGEGAPDGDSEKFGQWLTEVLLSRFGWALNGSRSGGGLEILAAQAVPFRANLIEWDNIGALNRHTVLASWLRLGVRPEPSPSPRLRHWGTHEDALQLTAILAQTEPGLIMADRWLYRWCPRDDVAPLALAGLTGTVIEHLVCERALEGRYQGWADVSDAFYDELLKGGDMYQRAGALPPRFTAV